MLKQVTISDLQRKAAEVIGDLSDGPVVISQRGRPAAVIVTAETYEMMERAVFEVEANQVREIVEAGLASYRAGRTSSHSVRGKARSRGSAKEVREQACHA